jgi:hypothetical protein
MCQRKQCCMLCVIKIHKTQQRDVFCLYSAGQLIQLRTRLLVLKESNKVI